MEAPSVFALQTHRPYLTAALFALAVSWWFELVFSTPPPRFMDVYLIGIAYYSARWSLGPALLIYFVSIVYAAWTLPPRESLAVTEGYDIYRMVSYSVTCLAVMFIIDHLKSRNDN